MNAVEIIRKKRDGEVLDKEELNFLVRGLIDGSVPDYQVLAFLMATFLRGMAHGETVSFTEVMLRSGEVLDLSEMESSIVDKHSTGGVGDKVSIVLAPLLAAAGVVVPMISGRGLGHTGGTLDKLESIPGFRTDLSIFDFRNALWDTGVAMMGQTEEIAPADRRLYALRDVTATVESIPLIASSIMSKKLSEGLDGLVLDVKVGTGAFMKTMEEAEVLARMMVEVGKSFGVKTVAVLTDMNDPIGKAVGNALEIRECINFLKGNAGDNLTDIVLTLGAWMLYIAEELVRFSEDKKTVDLGASISKGKLAEKRINLEGLINSGKALEKFVELLESQGGNPEIIANPGLLPVAGNILPVTAVEDGYITGIDAEKIGWAATLLGAGRLRAEDPVDHAAGITINRERGSEVKREDPVAVIHYNDDRNLEEALGLVEDAFNIGTEPPGPREIIRKIIQ